MQGWRWRPTIGSSVLVFGALAAFVRGPRAAIAHLRTLGRHDAAPVPGDNPLGGWSVVVMIRALATMVTAGVFAVDVDGLEYRPLADYVTFDQGRAAAKIHAFTFDVLLALHVLAIPFHLVGRRHDLVAPMIHNRRPLGEAETAEPLGASPWRAAIGVALALLFAWAVSTGLRI